MARFSLLEMCAGSMTIHYKLIPLDDRPGVMDIPAKLDQEEHRLTASQPIQSVLSGDADDTSTDLSDLGAVLAKATSIVEDSMEIDRERDIVIGRFFVCLDKVELPQLKNNVHSCFCVMKCQHHWVMTSSLPALPILFWRWLVKLPVYDPATIVSLSVFGGTGRLGQVSYPSLLQ